MKKFKIFLFIFLSISIFTTAENINKRYKMSQSESGTLFFILPQKIPSVASELKCINIDITYLTNRDSVTINATLITKQKISLDSIGFYSLNLNAINKPQLIYVQKKSNNWVYRFGVKLPYSLLRQAYKEKTTFRLVLYSLNSQFCFQYPESKWEKNKKWMNEILSLIDLNSQIQK